MEQILIHMVAALTVTLCYALVRIFRGPDKRSYPLFATFVILITANFLIMASGMSARPEHGAFGKLMVEGILSGLVAGTALSFGVAALIIGYNQGNSDRGDDA
jgi:hypothetical protein